MGLLYIVLIFSIFYSLVNAHLTEQPINTAVVAGVGSTVTLRCVAHASPPAVRIRFTEYATDIVGRLVSDNRGVIRTHPNAARYAITGNAAQNEFFLTISNVVLADGGRYLCEDDLASPPNTDHGFAELVVFASEPNCKEYAPSSGLVFEHTEYYGECSVHYKGNLVPNMRWLGKEGTFDTSGTQTPDHVWSHISFTPDRTFEGLSYHCETNFTEPQSGRADSATNAPDFQHVFKGSSLTVVRPPVDMSVTPIKALYEVGDVLTCFADSKPESSYQWMNMRILLSYPPGPSLTVTADLAGTTQIMKCIAVTNIGGNNFTMDFFHNVTVLASTTSVPTTTPAANGKCKDPTGRWLATNPSAMLCLEADSDGNILSIIRNGTDLFFVAGTGTTTTNDYSHTGFTLWPYASFGITSYTGECHSCYGYEVLLMSSLTRNKHNSLYCGYDGGSQVTNLYVFTRNGPSCMGMTVDEVRTNQPWILDKMGIKAKKILPA